MTPSPTLQDDYIHRVLPEAERAYQELSLMRELLVTAQRAATSNPNKHHTLSVTLRKQVNYKSPSILLGELDDGRQQKGSWKPASTRPLEVRSETLGELLTEAGELGEEWLRVLNEYGVQNLPPLNPIYNRQPGV